MGFARMIAAAAALALGACGSQPSADEGNATIDPSVNRVEAKAALPSCPFQEIHELKGSIEGGRLLVTGRVDLMMAGFKPQLSPRAGGSGTLALDLALVPEANAGVSDVLRYERTGVPAYPRGEIWCGGERLASFDMILVG
ncbi:MAG TPA: hypothetical protein VFO69_00990 [Allosphingosinicella sp.]|nr:hypothetical protein [Allosphingosinicella sp.]